MFLWVHRAQDSEMNLLLSRMLLHLWAVPRCPWESLQGSYCSLEGACPRPAAEPCRGCILLFIHSSIKPVQVWFCEPIPDQSPCFSLSSLPSSALVFLVLAWGACAWPICSVPYVSRKDCQVRAWCSVTRLQPGAAGLSFLSPTWSLGNSLIVHQGRPWIWS